MCVFVELRKSEFQQTGEKMKEWNINDAKNPRWMVYQEDWYYPGAVFFDSEEEARTFWENEKRERTEPQSCWNGSCIAKIEDIIVQIER